MNDRPLPITSGLLFDDLNDVFCCDYYEPESAAHLLRGLIGLDDESARVSVRVWALDAEVKISEQ